MVARRGRRTLRGEDETRRSPTALYLDVSITKRRAQSCEQAVGEPLYFSARVVESAPVFRFRIGCEPDLTPIRSVLSIEVVEQTGTRDPVSSRSDSFALPSPCFLPE